MVWLRVMTKKEIKDELEGLGKPAESFFAEADAFLKANPTVVRTNAGRSFTMPLIVSEGWRSLPSELQDAATQLRTRVGTLGVEYVNAVKASPLLIDADESEIRVAFRVMSAALVLRDYSYHDPYAIAEEDRVFGVVPAGQKEEAVLPIHASSIFDRARTKLLEKLELLLPSEHNLTKAIVAAEAPEVRSYRPNTAFIMMQISSDIPKLEDVKNSLKEVFKRFGVKAIRSDEIEHQDVITQRILDEIATSEFLVADLTGARPSVYYEVGYAHALKRRPILYRQKGTPLHFDLMVHNVPEYENITDLKKRLTDRLAALTGREPSE
jgi:hypothetical protein